MEKKSTTYDAVNAHPVKSFFVTMLTRDITLEEAILDLLDNCVDGILRMKKVKNEEKPYNGFWAKIEFDKNNFSIEDNCGGIPWSLHDYAFRMGRPQNQPHVPGSVGVYGIGLKRAIFKMGKDCVISTQNEENSYEINITPEWIRNEKDWDIPVRPASKRKSEDGTDVLIGDLYPQIAVSFSDKLEAFKNNLRSMIAAHYAFIIEKGFEVTICGQMISPRPTKLVFSREPKKRGKPAIQPFLFKTKIDDVEVFLAVGFTRPIPSLDEIDDEKIVTRYSSLDAGWTVLCNDRAVIYCDRSMLTGWGETGIPRYHTQFRAISGIVEFKAKDASKLPTNTIKRGIDASSPLYLKIKNKMREGMRIFTDYTNQWKGRESEAKKHILEAGKPLSFSEIKTIARKIKMVSTKGTTPSGEQFKPKLHYPEQLDSRKRRISFIKDIDDIELVTDFLFDDEDIDPSVVGEACFDFVLKEARK